MAVQTERLLQVQNNTAQRLTVFVQYFALTDQGTWAWLPADPSNSDQPLAFDLDAGQTAYLSDNGNAIAASRVRLWAVSDKQQWGKYKDEDLWLVPEQDDQGNHVYIAAEMKTFNFTFGR
jgi:hypothetical protein